ncbi:MAG: exodeoxyribonuclease VII small subunit [Raoultibacter sp.]
MENEQNEEGTFKQSAASSEEFDTCADDFDAEGASCDEPGSFAAVKDRLEEIVAQVSDESTSLDDALALYEEAVKLSMKASHVLEEQIA